MADCGDQHGPPDPDKDAGRKEEEAYKGYRGRCVCADGEDSHTAEFVETGTAGHGKVQTEVGTWC